MKVSYKRGSKRRELAKKLRKTSKNFKMSRDVYADRGTQKSRLGRRR